MTLEPGSHLMEEMRKRAAIMDTPRLDDALLARMATESPRIPWDAFTHRLQWLPGEHFALIGPTGQGKTTMLLRLASFMPYVVVFATKPRDTSMTRILDSGYVKFEHWRSYPARDIPRRVLWPNANRLHSAAYQRRVFEDALDKIYREGAWCITIDELLYVTSLLHLEKEIRTLYTQGRSMDISLLISTQRPARIPLEAYDQSTHLMFWRNSDYANLKRLAEINVRSSALIRAIVPNLDQHQVLYINTRTGDMYRTRIPSGEATS